ncbi:PD-(D/E)XK nuclease family protein [Nodosilinea sp. LEGE 06152]|uniref:PD-(D/E)XK nuclease family protein n=1 Tax=Nodosilinea sp. LEGE 06152 TaxID=2777966 RepID=UPI0018801EE2|nr:PD-(D/E)XK nuclease family protein [Nodosilinea sp. LEGE 06152]MBE9156812.1 PD-(D/E)XK nuclease family protein [Nodosilinea sp. LEGE 06152]
MLTLTQSHLRQLEICPRRYQYGYLEQVPVPTDPEMLERQRWGTQFHLVMQQRELDLPIEGFLEEDAALDVAVQGLLAAAPELFTPQADRFRQSEHRRTLAFNGYLLTAIYDLLLLEPNRGQIIDWKTYQHPPKQAQLAKHWQTRLYLYLLVETSDLAPEQVSMTYWFVAPPGAEARSEDRAEPPSSIAIAYSEAQHRRTEADLRRLTDRLTDLMAPGDDLPKVDPESGHCAECSYAVRCQRWAERFGEMGGTVLPAIADIAEVPL